MQNYEKISVSKVSKHGRYLPLDFLLVSAIFLLFVFRLFYTNYGLFGALSTSRMNIYNANYRCYFIDETEIIKEINVPYHCTERYII